MGKSLFIAEKPSVAQEFARVLKINASKKDGYLEDEHSIVTWCVGHLVTMSYPEAYDPALKKWSMQTLPFLPETYRYEVIEGVKKQFGIVASLLRREDVDTIYVCTDSGREGEYIYRLVEQEAQVPAGKSRRRVWIDSQTEEEILRGIKEAKDLKEYDNLSASAYLRAKEDYLMGINFSRLLTLKFGNEVARYINEKYCVVSVGRVMTCVLGMVVRREREIRDFQKTMFYRVLGSFSFGKAVLTGEWRVTDQSRYAMSPLLYKENGFKHREDAQRLMDLVTGYAKDLASTKEDGEAEPKLLARLASIEKKKEKKSAPLLYNLAELQNECSKRFKISPDETLRIVQELYEKKLVTYPRTDARVLSSAVAKEIDKNLRGLCNVASVAAYAQEVLHKQLYEGIAKTKYTDDKQITDHYAIIPTGQGSSALSGLSQLSGGVYEMIAKRFLSIFYPPAVYKKFAMDLCEEGTYLRQNGEAARSEEHFYASFRLLVEEGYLKVAGIPKAKKKAGDEQEEQTVDGSSLNIEEEGADLQACIAQLERLKKGDRIPVTAFQIKEGETQPPSRYNSGTMILAMENAGQLIEDEELRAQIKGSGIGTSATRAEILKKLVTIQYLHLNKKTQIITPTLRGELVYEVICVSMPQMLNPDLTASWEKGLTYVADGSITEDEYMQKLSGFIEKRCIGVKQINRPQDIYPRFQKVGQYYKK